MINMYKYEMHIHNSGCSACGKNTVQEMIDAAREKGYAGIVFTNHFYHGNTGVDRALPWADFVGEYKKSYEEALKYAAQFDFDILFGIEEGLGGGKEALIYGLSPEIIAATPEFAQMDLSAMAKFVRENGGIIVCAHPYRNRPYISNPDMDPDPAFFDGVEVYNEHNSEDENNRAMAFAERYGLIKISGGDIHLSEHIGASGVAFKNRIRNNEQLVTALKSGDYELITE